MTDDDDLHAHDGDATDLTAEERVGLIPTWIVTRDDLNRAERANIAKGLRWARRGRFDVLDPDALMTLHTRMYGDVWRWAGQPRQSERNIGRDDWWKLREHLVQLLGNIRAQVEHGGRDPDEIAIDFHHQLVAIHVFPNGNGRHVRLAADLLAERLGRPLQLGPFRPDRRRRRAGSLRRRPQGGRRRRPWALADIRAILSACRPRQRGPCARAVL